MATTILNESPFVRQQHDRVTISCKRCGALAKVDQLQIIGPGVRFTWTRLPDGWWRVEAPQLHCRCPACLLASAFDEVQS